MSSYRKDRRRLDDVCGGPVNVLVYTDENQEVVCEFDRMRNPSACSDLMSQRGRGATEAEAIRDYIRCVIQAFEAPPSWAKKRGTR